MVNNINTFKITPLKQPKQECCGYDVDANEDGCSIIPCDCKICTHNKTEQLSYLIEEINHVGKEVIDANSTLTIYQMFENIKEKIEQINQNKQVYGNGSGR